jgi:hypothetical protein
VLPEKKKAEQLDEWIRFDAEKKLDRIIRINKILKIR